MEQQEKIKLPFFATVFGSYNLLAEKLLKFLGLASLFALVSMAISFACGQSSMCLNAAFRQTYYCVDYFPVFLSLRLVVLALALMFLSRWYRYALLGEKLNLKKLFVPTSRDVKITGLFLSYILTFVIAGISFYMLLKRVPNPNWKIELCYFTVVSLGFLAPILGLKFLSYFAYAAEGIALPSPKIIWRKTAQNMLPIISFFCIFLMIIIFFVQTSIRFTFVVNPKIYHAIVTEYLSTMILFLVIACFMNYCYIQKNIFEKENTDEKTAN